MKIEPPGHLKTSWRNAAWIRLVVLILVVVAAVVGYAWFGDSLTLQSLAERETQLREFQTQYPILVYGVAFLVYVAITGLSLPGAAALTMLYGWYFGVIPGVVLVSIASTTGATVAFLLSRFLFRDAVQTKFGERLAAFNEALKTDGPFYLFTLRLIPAVPFFAINAVMGLTPIRTWTFWWVSQLGMLAGTFVYVYAGSTVPNLTMLAEMGVNAAFSPARLIQITMAFVLLGMFPLVTRWILKSIQRRRRSQPNISNGTDAKTASTKKHP